jgi:hypothetical protein
MYRRIVSLLLLPCVLLTQSVAVFGHAHGGNQPAGHDLRPHFHTNPASARHDHGHHHHGPDGHHHHHNDGDAPAEPDSKPAQQPEPLSGDEHDSDAVFVDCVDVVITPRSVATDDELAVSLPWATAGLFLPVSLWTDPSQEAANWTHAPPLRDCACPLYLRQLTLLI